MKKESVNEQNFINDLDERFLLQEYPHVLNTLLIDRTTGHNILWATDDYQELSPRHQAHAEMTVAAITGEYLGIIAPRVAKSRDVQSNRTKSKAEVFTPSWMCNEQNNLIDEAWFGRSDVFNIQAANSWKATEEKIIFPDEKKHSWCAYVDERHLEITCGEAPYLVSRYDTTTGKSIDIQERIGLLDRKLRVVTENTQNEKEWLKWTKRAFQSIYGFEFQGDSLFLARENLLATYIDYVNEVWKRQPTEQELRRIATIISWNLWQMDGLTGYPPYSDVHTMTEQISIFDLLGTAEAPIATPCKIKDWRVNQVITFLSLKKNGEQRYE